MNRRESSVGTHLTSAFAVLVVLIAVVSASGIAALVIATRQADRISTAVTPALEATTAALQSMTDAETGIRGYALTGDDEFLEPYERGRVSVLRHLDRAERATTEDATLNGLVRDSRQDVDRWLTEYADLVAAGPGGVGTSDVAAEERAKTVFDDFRTDNATLSAELSSQRTRALESVRTLRTIGVVSVSAITVVALAIGTVMALRTRRRLLRPLERLQHTVDRLRDGDHDARADADHGPVEVRAVSGAVNLLADETDRLRAAEAEATRLRAMTHETSRSVREHLDPGRVAEAAVAAVGQGLDVDRVWLRLRHAGRFGPAQGEWCRPGLNDLAQMPHDISHWAPLIERLWAQGEVMTIDDTDTEPLLDNDMGRDWRRATRAASAMSAPVGAGEEVLGLLTVTQASRRRWRPEEALALQAVAADLGRALRQADLYVQQQQLVVKLQDLDREKTDFLSTVSHELRTPLTSIAGYVELLRDGDGGDVDPEGLRMLDVVQRNTSRLQALIEDLLTLSRIESGGLRGDRAEVDVAAIARSAAAAVEPGVRSGGLQLDVDLGEVELRTTGDERQLERVLLNLLSNAVKFTPAGGRVRLTARCDGDDVVVVCQDTGIGIPAADLGRLGSRFFRAANATAKAVPGTGLGLAIVRGIAEQHGGRFDLESVEGEGTTVTVRLPASVEVAVPV